MPNKELQALLERVPTWPQDMQDDVLALLQFYEQELRDPSELTEEDKAAIDEGVDDIRNGRMASDQAVRELLDRYRRS